MRCAMTVSSELPSPCRRAPTQRLTPRRAPENLSNVSFVQADAQTYRFPPARFDSAMNGHFGTGIKYGAHIRAARAGRPG